MKVLFSSFHRKALKASKKCLLKVELEGKTITTTLFDQTNIYYNELLSVKLLFNMT